MGVYTEKLKYFFELQKNSSCKGCGEKLHDVTCVCCNNEIENAEFIVGGIKAIIDSLPKENMDYSTDINLLYQMKNISIVNKYIEEIGYEKVLEIKKQELFSKSYEDLTDDEIKSCEFLTEYFLNDDERKKIYNDALLVRCLNKQNRYSLQFIEQAYLSFVGEIAKNSKLYGDINISELNINKEGPEKTLGSCGNYSGRIYIDREGLIKLCNGDPGVFLTFFHEMRHREQNNVIIGKIDNQEPAVLLWIKDKLLSQEFPKYYKDNYSIISFETDAFISSYNIMLGISSINEDAKKEYIEELEDVREKVNNYGIMRIDGGELSTVEELFDDKIKISGDMLRRFPILNYQYIEDEKTGKIRHRTVDEINKYMDDTSAGKTNLNGREMLRKYLIATLSISEKENIVEDGIKKV